MKKLTWWNLASVIMTLWYTVSALLFFYINVLEGRLLCGKINDISDILFTFLTFGGGDEGWGFS